MGGRRRLLALFSFRFDYSHLLLEVVWYDDGGIISFDSVALSFHVYIEDNLVVVMVAKKSERLHQDIQSGASFLCF